MTSFQKTNALQDAKTAPHEIADNALDALGVDAAADTNLWRISHPSGTPEADGATSAGRVGYTCWDLTKNEKL